MDGFAESWFHRQGKRDDDIFRQVNYSVNGHAILNDRDSKKVHSQVRSTIVLQRNDYPSLPIDKSPGSAIFRYCSIIYIKWFYTTETIGPNLVIFEIIQAPSFIQFSPEMGAECRFDGLKYRWNNNLISLGLNSIAAVVLKDIETAI